MGAAALDDIAKVMPFPILGVDSDNGSEFINHHLGGVVRETPDHLHPVTARQLQRRLPRRAEELGHRPDRGRLPPLRHRAEPLLLNKIWMLQSTLANYFYPQQKLVSKTRVGAKVSKKYDTATTPYRRAVAHDTVVDEDKAILADIHDGLNPAGIQRQIQALTGELLTPTTSKAAPKTKAPVAAPAMRASTNESTNQTSR
jgi:hypothetical protein